MAFDASTTSLTANSFVLVAEADTYFADRYGYDDWTALTTTVKEQLLVTASQRINQETFVGTTTTDLRDLQFPKTDIYDRFGDLIDELVVPQNIQNAVFEQAFVYQSTGIFDDAELNDIEMITNLSESDAGIARSYTFGRIEINRICALAKKELKMIPNVWAGKVTVSNIVR